MSGLIFGVSGVRGIVNSSFFPQHAFTLGQSFGRFISGDIVVGRDTRRTGDMILSAFVSGFLSSGNSITNLCIVPTPTVLLNAAILRKGGGAVITASHNPLDWNGLKFIGKDGIFLSEDDIGVLYGINNKGEFQSVSWDRVGRMECDDDGVKRHIGRILSLINVERIRSKRFRVIFDGGGGALSSPVGELLSLLGCDFKIINSKRDPEPLSANLMDIKGAFREDDFDIGFASDMDGDRIAVITEEGEVPGEEYTLPLALSHILKHKKGKVVTNFSTSRMVEHIVGASVERTKVGEANVVRKMRDIDAIFGGEGNGGVIWPDMHLTRDGLSAISLILDYMADENESISKLIKRFPSFYMRKEKIEVSGEFDLERLARYLPMGEVNYEDGLRIDYDDGFIHIRKSNTEGVIRIICETEREETCNKLIKEARKLLTTKRKEFVI